MYLNIGAQIHIFDTSSMSSHSYVTHNNKIMTHHDMPQRKNDGILLVLDLAAGVQNMLFCHFFGLGANVCFSKKKINELKYK